MKDIPNIFGSLVFNDKVMRERLPKETYRVLKNTIAKGRHLELDVAHIVANAMKNWAIEKGATHYTHWFQPMTGITAEKHDSFISPTSDGGIIMEFSGKELVHGEPDASSFPSGGLRATFEARGYTAWDPTSYAFVKDNSLFIPTAFCSYSGEALDKKTPLLRSMEVISKQALRVVKLFGNENVNCVRTTVGAEQEYFLIDKDVYKKRPDLMYCGRTLFGARPPKGQELDDHYFGKIKPRILKFMEELDERLWELGVLAKTKHNEAAPGQHELAPVFTTTNVAADHNQLTMELMKSIADKHNLACLLHEKPFAGVNGSGKHNNWSISTDKGTNLLEPGDTPHKNKQFLVFLAAILKAVDKYQDLLRVSVASAGNDHRLGASEAPPAIVSIYLGEQLSEVLEAIEKGTLYKEHDKCQMESGAIVLPHFFKDTTDRNRTSPLAFTGNKFEFRMLGSAFSISDCNIVLNTAVSEVLDEFATKLENSENFSKDVTALIKETVTNHKRVVFNGNNYSDEWIDEAEKRGLLNLRTTVDALPTFIAEKNRKLFAKYGVFCETEMQSRYEILLEGYSKTIHIEALTMIDMVNKGIIPSVIKYQQLLIDVYTKKATFTDCFDTMLEESLLKKISKLATCLAKKLEALENSVMEAKNYDNSLEIAKYYRDSVFANMCNVRGVVDELETIVGKEFWAYPTYDDILYSVK